MRAKFGVLEQNHGIDLHAKFRLDWFILSPSGGEKPKILRFFWTSVLSPLGGSLRKLNTSAQPQTFPYPTASKPFLYNKAFTAKSGAQTLTFKSMTNRQRDRQKKNSSTFLTAPATGKI